MIIPYLISGCLLGWALGGNDSANCFATAVSTKSIKYSTAVKIIAIFVVLGAYLEGHKGINKVSDFAYNSGIVTPLAAFLIMLAASLTVILMTILKFPVSTSQSVIGSILGSAVLVNKADFTQAFKFFGAWFLTPIGGIIIGFIIYKFLERYIEKRFSSITLYDKFIRVGFLIAGAFSSYSLGANNVANVTSIYTGKINIISTEQAVLIGGITIAIGAMTFSKAVMKTVGNNLAILSPTAGLVAVIASSIVVYIYAQVGIPVSTSQAVVGAIIGIGLVKGTKTVNFKSFRNILFAWIGTPITAGLISMLLFKLYIY